MKRKSSTKKTLFILLILTICKLSIAQSIITDRPDQTESSSTIDKGSIQIESGGLVGFTEQNSTRQRQILAPSTLFRIAIIQPIELRILTQFESLRNLENGIETNGISDIEIGTKIQIFRKENINIEIAFLSHLIIPTGSKYITSGKFGTINKLSIAHELTKNINLGYNLGYNYFGNGKGDLTYSLALGFGITQKASVYIESYGDLVNFESFVSSLDAGFTYLLQDNLQLDFSFGTGVNHKMNYLSAGFSWNIKTKKVNKKSLN